LLIRVNSFAILFQRANIVALRVSKMRPMRATSSTAGAGDQQASSGYVPTLSVLAPPPTRRS
jgi:hypothetical protein